MIIDKPITVNTLVTLGQRLRRARLDANLTQGVLAERVGISIKTISNAENGQNISLETFALLLQGIGRAGELDGLLADEGPSPVKLAKRLGRTRQRASGRRSKGSTDNWQW